MTPQIDYIFPTYLIKFKFDKHQKYSNIFDELNTVEEHQPPTWTGQVHTSCNTKNNILENSVQEEIKKDISECIKKNLPDDVIVRVNDFWYNIYKKNFYQEAHDHCDLLNFLSGIYFHKNATPPIFYNYQTSLLKAMGFATVLQDSWFNTVRPSTYVPKIKDGDIIIFPSDLVHEVPRYNSDKLRITFSFNITLNPKSIPDA